ncbi:C39 family peptidase [Streptomyces sp. NPDC006798]|uniref:C39 family peptidase n=1 Tax=Streptomyces sp. NPDC006798 TaxID=3155462 RepID=UPI0033F23355
MPLPCCTDPTPGPLRPPHDVPSVTQYASPGLIHAFAYEGRDIGDDPEWSTSGAATVAEYRHWAGHLCGMACLRMALLHRDGYSPSLFALADGARHYGAYTEQPDGEIKGLIYGPFARYVHKAHDMTALVHPKLTMEDLTGLLDDGNLVMASVHKSIRTPETDPPRRGGHLVLVRGRTPEGGIVFNNPSGHTPSAREATLPAGRFADYFAGRGVSLTLHPATATSPDPAASTSTVPVAPSI